MSQEEEQHRPPAGVTVPEDRNPVIGREQAAELSWNWYSWVLLGRVDGGLLKAAGAAQWTVEKLAGFL